MPAKRDWSKLAQPILLPLAFVLGIGSFILVAQGGTKKTKSKSGPDEPPPSEEDRRLASGFEANVERIALMLRSGIHDNQIIAMRKTNQDPAAHLAELLGVMQKDLRRIEVALREMAVQASSLNA